METELKLLKTCLYIPKMREQLKHAEYEKLDFKCFLQEINKLTLKVKELLAEEGCIANTKELKEEIAERDREKMERERFKLN